MCSIRNSAAGTGDEGPQGPDPQVSPICPRATHGIVRRAIEATTITGFRMFRIEES
jgi:hypothetical protein